MDVYRKSKKIRCRECGTDYPPEEKDYYFPRPVNLCRTCLHYDRKYILPPRDAADLRRTIRVLTRWAENKNINASAVFQETRIEIERTRAHPITELSDDVFMAMADKLKTSLAAQVRDSFGSRMIRTIR